MTTLQSEFLFDMQVEIGQIQQLGATPRGSRLIAPLTGGTFDGPKLKGDVVPGGADWLLTRVDGIRELDVRLTLRSDDGQLIYMSYRGISTMTPEMASRVMRGELVNSSEYYMRITPVFETGAERYAWLNRLVAVGVGERLSTAVRYKVYAIL